MGYTQGGVAECHGLLASDSIESIVSMLSEVPGIRLAYLLRFIQAGVNYFLTGKGVKMMRATFRRGPLNPAKGPEGSVAIELGAF